MRPPMFSTPPASHVVSRKFEATPAATGRHDWRNLTTDTSIQIMSLESSAYHEENSIYDVTNQLSFVDTIISPRADDIFPWTPLASSPVMDRAETLVSMDALTHHYGNMSDARLIFTPKQRCLATPSANMEPAHVPVRKHWKTDCYQKRLSRNFISDSNLEIQRKADHEHKNRHALVARSLSLNYAECTRTKHEDLLVKPILPCSYKSKIGGVKRIPSFRNAMSTAPVINYKVDSNNYLSKPKDLSVNQHDHQKQRSVHDVDMPQSKITKLVKCGIRSVMKSKTNSDERSLDISSCLKSVSASEKRRQRKTRYSTNIGGLSDFLRKNERRKTIAVITEEKNNRDVNNVTASETDIEISGREFSNQCDRERNVSRPVMGSRRLHSMGMSNLKFDQCQRKLVFQNSQCSPKLNAGFDPVNYTEQYISPVNEENGQTRLRPRLGVLGKTKPINTLPIDELDIDVVCDLKRRVERANRCTRIKTNGSLKVRPKLLPAIKPVVPSPRRKSALCRQSRICTAPSSGRHYKLKRESIV
ncbi:uncharacterized protein LOC132752034 [Ruditapes philippinarum]|uniref:uncharacterized protein LOC132752034 n=1 Tax=Ruditapes philippinarum TaxID=129788 RepID=UPI00295AE238|nr:uncharacterized protein LOC132752034 [Ruditapes philippinarum]